MKYRIVSILILFVVFNYFKPHAQIVHEVFRAYPGIANNWISGTEKLNDSTYLLQEYVSVQTPNGLQIQTALVKVDKNWQQIDSVVIPEMYMLLLKQKDGLIYWVGNRGLYPSYSVLFVLNLNLEILKHDTLRDELADFEILRIRDIPNGIGILGVDRTTGNSFVYEVTNGGQLVSRKDIKQGNRNIKLVEDFCYLPAENKYALVGAFMRPDTVKVGSDFIQQLGLFDTNFNTDSIRFISFYPTNTGPRLKRAPLFSEFLSEITLTSDSTFTLVSHGKDLQTILSDPWLAYQMSISRWTSDLNLLSHEMYGRKDTLDRLSVYNTGKDFQGNLWVGIISEVHNTLDWDSSRSEIGLLQFSPTGVKLKEEYIRRPNKKLNTMSFRWFGDSLILISGHYYEFNGGRPLRSRDAFFMVINPSGISSSTRPLGSNQINVKVYPNPSNGVVKFDLEGDIEYIKIKDIQGKLLRQSVDKEVDLSGLPEGMYIYHLRTQSGKINTGKILRN